MQCRITRVTLAALALVALIAGSAVAAPKSPKPGKGHPGIRLGVSKPKGGTTVVTVNDATLTALTNAGVAVTPSGKATASGASFSFPITGGSIVYKKGNHGKGKGAKKKLLSGYLLHTGSGLTLTKTTTTGPLSATISDFRITLAAGKTGRLDVKLGNSKLKLATLSNVVVNATSRSINATVTLTPNAVTMLNSAFGTTLPTSSATLGTLVITPTF